MIKFQNNSTSTNGCCNHASQKYIKNQQLLVSKSKGCVGQTCTTNLLDTGLRIRPALYGHWNMALLYKITSRRGTMKHRPSSCRNNHHDPLQWWPHPLHYVIYFHITGAWAPATTILMPIVVIRSIREAPTTTHSRHQPRPDHKKPPKTGRGRGVASKSDKSSFSVDNMTNTYDLFLEKLEQ